MILSHSSGHYLLEKTQESNESYGRIKFNPVILMVCRYVHAKFDFAKFVKHMGPTQMFVFYVRI